MLTFLFKRLAQAIVVMFVISLVAFAIQDNLGDPLREMVGQVCLKRSVKYCEISWV